jgi:formylglycine-generating enzyme required for sulfatase activity
MSLFDYFVLIERCDDLIPYDFYISRYPVLPSGLHVGEGAEDTPLFRASWPEAVAYCNNLSRRNRLEPAYDETTLAFREQPASPAFLTNTGFRVPTQYEWEYAAKGWSGRRTGDYFEVLKQQRKVPYIDYPTTEQQKTWFESGYSTKAELPANQLGIHGLLVYAKEWCSETHPSTEPVPHVVRWDEYFTNYDNDIGYTTMTALAEAEAPFPFHLVLPKAE